MVLGGVPFYLSLIKKEESFPQTIDRLYFAPNAPLKDEFDRLFSSLFRSPEPYVEIIRVLAHTKEGLTRDEIAAQTKILTGGRLSGLLADLINCDFIRPYYIRLQRKVSKRDCFYVLSDMFSLFHLHFDNNRSHNPNFWQQHLNTPVLNTWRGLAFEQVVMKHIEQVKRALGISGIAVEYYAWRSKKTEPKSQIDLILDRADRILNICEIKYAYSHYSITKTEEEKLLLRQRNFCLETGTNQGIHLTMITPFGVSNNSYKASVTSEVTLDDLFA